MQVIINDIPVTIPTTLLEFTLGERIRFQQQHGSVLDEKAKLINDMEDGIDKDFAILEYNFEKMLCTFSFFSGIDVEVLKDSELLDEVASIYHASMAVLFDQEDELQLQQEYIWNGELWCLHPPELKQGSKMTFNELISAKQIVQNMNDVANGSWQSMLYLCAIYFRKKDEPFKEEFIYDGSDRLKLMESLPMEYALAVGFFLLSCLHTYMNISPYFTKHK